MIGDAPSAGAGFMTPAEFCEMLSISRRTLRRYISDGVVPCVRLSRRNIRIPGVAVKLLTERRAAA
jgi:excisionase family DNA binding protein